MNMLCLLAMLSAAPAEPTAEQLSLLKTFRAEFVAISPGEGKFPKTFRMGREKDGTDAERPVREVTMRGPFSIAKYEVPQNLWQAVIGTDPSRWKGPRNSVEELTFADATEFCKKSTELMRAAKLIAEDEEIRLPSEAEWEYCARAGTTTVYSFGDDAAKLNDFAWSTHNAAGNDPPVGAKKPNDWGLYDMHGYLWEWCEDAWHETYKDAPTTSEPWVAGTDGKGSTAKGGHPRRVLRGGSWKDKAEQLTSSFRQAARESLKDDAVGLRCVLAKLKKSESK